MNKIIGIIKPFDVYQTFYAYVNGDLKDFQSTVIDEIPETVFIFAKFYNINEVELTGGNKDFLEGIGKKIQEKEMEKYNCNKLKINCI